MGCDIHCYAERRVGDGWEMIQGLYPFQDRNYTIFAFLADVHNEVGVQSIAQPRELPADISDGVVVNFWHCRDDAHSLSWLSMSELNDYDYDRTIKVEKRCGLMAAYCGGGDGGVNDDEVEVTTIRALLGDAFFDDLQELKARNAERIVFWFDN
ncbi:hypothetical protein [Microvirga makkahensis]|nr:hypothetical protein [Microvirga makkahensis]